jgi:DNA-binding CsgD family transcriptional regulator
LGLGDEQPSVITWLRGNRGAVFKRFNPIHEYAVLGGLTGTPRPGKLVLAMRVKTGTGWTPPLVCDPETESADAPIPFDLTGRELEVLLLLAAGDSNRVIGQKLFISPRTASVHVSNILGKMGVGGRVEAAAVAHRLGLAGVDRTPRDQPSSIAADAVSREATLT